MNNKKKTKFWVRVVCIVFAAVFALSVVLPLALQILYL